jgi:hypothetical protein
MTAVNDPIDDLGQLWVWFADTSCRGYSPIYDQVSRAVSRNRDVLALIREAPPAAHQPTVLLAAVHFLLLGGLQHPLAEVYAGRSQVDPGPLFCELCLSHRSDVLEIMATRRIQTNEVGRSALIGPALTWVARTVGEPLRLVDVGASAGLNLLCDRYLLDYGTWGTTGPVDAEVRISCRVAFGAPPIAPRLPSISTRVGIDRDPPDLRNPEDARWQLACVWPDTGRLSRTKQAIAFAQRDLPVVVQGDALVVLPEILGGLDPGGVVCVVTTWVFAYFLLDERKRFVEMLLESAKHRPIAWVAGEGAGIVDLVETGDLPDYHDGESNALTAVVFDATGAHPTLLGFAQPHGMWLDWRA